MQFCVKIVTIQMYIYQISYLMQVFQALVKLYRVHQLVSLYSGKRLNNY